MTTVDTKITTSPVEAAEFVQRGQLAAFPTETVYGLGADVFQPEAVEAIFAAKGRPSDNPLIVHLAHRDQLFRVVSEVSTVARKLLDAFVPGPLTLILPRHPDVPEVVTAGLDTIGVRFPANEMAQAFLEACGTPVAAPSANRSGRPSPTTWAAVEEDLGGRIACILKGGQTDAGVESTVLDCTVDPPCILRPGAVSVEELRAVIGSVDVELDEEGEAAPRSPGTKHRHYAPAAPVRVVDDPAEAPVDSSAGYIGLDSPPDIHSYRKCYVAPDAEAYAQALFQFFRECDRAGCSMIVAQRVSPAGLGLALNDRLERAAAR